MFARIRAQGALRTFSIGFAMQSILSGANFVVSLILVRRASDLDYSYYVLAVNAFLLLTSLHGSFLRPHTVIGLSRMPQPERQAMIGGVVRERGRWIPLAGGILIVVTGVSWLLGMLPADRALLFVICILTALTVLDRDFFRGVIIAYHLPMLALRADSAFVVLLVAGVYAATFMPMPAQMAILALGIASAVGAALLRRSVWLHEAWEITGAPNILRDVARIGGWALLGSGIHWALSQGYSYLVAGLISVRDVAALAATRLTLMPIFLMSSGVNTLLFPITSRWVHHLGPAAAARRLGLLVAALLVAAVCYFGLMWFTRDWIFAEILKKDFAQRDALLLLWGAVFLVTLSRDQLSTYPAAREKFKDLTLLTALSAAVWLASSYYAIKRWGGPGAVLGILLGELINVAGILILMRTDMRQAAEVKEASE